LVKLYIENIHARTKHGNVSEVMFKVRKRLWIIRARQRIQNVIKGCLVCRKSRLGKQIPILGDLPDDRTNTSYPFTVVGLDHFGPFYTKIGTKTVKSYGLIITCFGTRSINIEWSEDLTADRLMNALRRHCARYGYPRKVYSDNSKTFQKGRNHMISWGNFIVTSGLQKFISDEGIEWVFISPLSPWKGGVWERLIRSIKEKLRKVVGRGLWQYDELITLFAEVSSIINSRPLTYVSDSDVSQFPLSPELFLTGGMPKLLLRCSESGEVSNKELRSAEKRRRSNIIVFWKVFIEDYLKQLRGVHEVNPRSTFKSPYVDQIVLVEQVTSNPYFWPLGRITKVYPDDKGVVRTVKVKLGSGETYVRPTKLIRYLELDKHL